MYYEGSSGQSAVIHGVRMNGEGTLDVHGASSLDAVVGSVADALSRLTGHTQIPHGTEVSIGDYRVTRGSYTERGPGDVVKVTGDEISLGGMIDAALSIAQDCPHTLKIGDHAGELVNNVAGLAAQVAQTSPDSSHVELRSRRPSKANGSLYASQVGMSLEGTGETYVTHDAGKGTLAIHGGMVRYEFTENDGGWTLGQSGSWDYQRISELRRLERGLTRLAGQLKAEGSLEGL